MRSTCAWLDDTLTKRQARRRERRQTPVEIEKEFRAASWEEATEFAACAAFFAVFEGVGAAGFDPTCPCPECVQGRQDRLTSWVDPGFSNRPHLRAA